MQSNVTIFGLNTLKLPRTTIPLPHVIVVMPKLDTLFQVALIATLILIATVVGILVIVLALRVLERRQLLKQKPIYLDVIPPAFTAKLPASTKELYINLHGLERSRSLRRKLILNHVTFSLEIVSTREDGIRFMVRVAEKDNDNFQHVVISFFQDIRLVAEQDYMLAIVDWRQAHIVDFRLTGDFIRPLNQHQSLEQSDPMAYITQVMTHLNPGELMAFQVVAVPAVKTRKARVMLKKLQSNEASIDKLGRQSAYSLAKPLVGTFNSLLIAVMGTFSEVSYGMTTGTNRKPDSSFNHEVQGREPGTFGKQKQQLLDRAHDKTDQSQYRINVRVMIVASDEQGRSSHIDSMRNLFRSFATSDQSLESRLDFPYFLKGRYRLYLFRNRLPGLLKRNASTVSIAEIADIYHFPYPGTADTENTIKSYSRTLPATTSLKKGLTYDVVLGKNAHHGSDTRIGFTADERERHVWIVGGTGNGKSTLMKYAIIQDIRNGKGVAVIDPHGDLAETILKYIPEERINDVIYFNPYDIDFPIGLNFLELPLGVSENEFLTDRDFITESIISIFRKIFSDDGSGGHRIEASLRTAILTAYNLPDATLFTVYSLLVDPDFAKKAVATLKDKDLVNYWNNYYGKSGEWQQVKMMGSVIDKINRFKASEFTKRMLGQPKSTINFDDIINSGKILICNIAKGYIGDDTSKLLGICVITKLQLAANKRIRMNEGVRRPFYLYVDEFQEFATISFVEMLSQARKYKLFLVMAEQSTSQQDKSIVNIILDNVGTIICFRASSPENERFILPSFTPHVKPGEIACLDAYNFYIRIKARVVHDPMSGQTLRIEDENEGSDEIAERVIEASRTNFATKYVAPLEPDPASEGPSTSEKEKYKPPKPRNRRKLNYRKKSLKDINGKK